MLRSCLQRGKELLRGGLGRSQVAKLQPLTSIPQGPSLATDLWQLGVRWKSKMIRDGLKLYKPVNSSQRGRVTTSREGLWNGKPFKALTRGMAKTGGRNNHGHICTWQRGGGHKRKYRVIDFARRAEGATPGRPEGATSGTVVRLEYDPNRSARIALVRSASDQHSYILAPQRIQAGDQITSGSEGAIRPGNSFPLSGIPIGQAIHNVELYPGRGGQMARAAGVSATLVSKGVDGYATVKLPSGEQRKVLSRCMATIGALSNPQHKNRKLGKAGASRWLGRRPHVRGVAMNSVDHPHGGGRGKSKGRISQSPWGHPAKGGRTRKPRNRTDAFIVLSRHKAKK